MGEVNEFAPGAGYSFMTFAFYHAVMPVLFQYMTLGLPGLLRDRRDDDSEDIIRALTVGNLNGLFILGPVLTQFADALQDKPWYKEDTSVPFFEIVTSFSGLANKIVYAETDEEKQKVYKELFKFINEAGLPLTTSQRWINNIEKVYNGETENIGEDILRLFNYSDYQIKGKDKPPTGVYKSKKEKKPH